MLIDFSFLATTSRGNEGRASYELLHLFEEIGDSTPAVKRTGVSGLIAIKTALNPFEAIEKLRIILSEHPYEFRYTLRVIPIERVVRTDLAQIRQAAIELSSRIAENETFRITVEKRFTEISTNDIIKTIAADIQRKVNLSKPDKILLIEIIGGLTGISLANPNDILSILKEKML